MGKSSRVDWFVVRFEASFRLLEESEQGFASFLCAEEEAEGQGRGDRGEVCDSGSFESGAV